MIRFQPDTWRDAILRPIAMAAPDAGVYMEIMVPDVRFAALVLLTAATLVMAVRRAQLPRSAWLLLAFVWLAFVPWLATTGNGRYFLPVLVVTGPLCIALIHHLPLTFAFRAALGLLLVAVQFAVVALNDPRGSWGLASWVDSYFEAEFGSEEREVPSTYVLVSSISYSLAAPLFHPDSHWINLASMSGDIENSPDDRRAQAALAASQRAGLPTKLLVPTVPHMTEGRQPNAQLRKEIDRLLAPHRLALASGDCRMVVSRTMASTAYRDLADAKPERLPKMGFWICPLNYPVPWRSHAAPPQLAARFDPVFERLESSCPRLFRPGEAKTVRIFDGFSRTYPSSDTKAYVLDNGEVWFKYWRALNGNAVGRVEDVLAEGFTLDCNQVRGRSGLPWERQL